MSYLLFKDISYAQGAYNMAANSDPAVMIKMSGGDGVTSRLYYDVQATRNYNNAVATNKVPMMYHFYGGGDPAQEADFFISACSPLAVGDIMAIDVESGTLWNPQTDSSAVSKVLAFVNRIHDKTGMWPWVYMNMSTANMYDWSPVLNNCGYWCAAPSYSFDDTLPVKYPQIAQQGPIVNGVDTNAFFGTLDDLKKYGYQSATPAPTPTPTPTPVPTPVITTETKTDTTPIPFKTVSVTDATLPLGQTKINQVGVDGYEDKTYEITYTDGVETSRTVVSDSTTPPVDQITAVGTYVEPVTPVPDVNNVSKVLLAITATIAVIIGIVIVWLQR